MTFLFLFLKMGLIVTPFLGITTFLWMKYHPQPQLPSEVEAGSKLFEKFGVLTVLLVVIGFVLWKVAGWARPKADALIDNTLDKAAALPGLLEENRKANSAQEARDAAIIATMQMAMELTKDLRERVDAQSKRTQLMSESISSFSAEQRANTLAMTALSSKIDILVQVLSAK